MAARAGFEPVTLWTQGTEPMPEPPLPQSHIYFFFGVGPKSIAKRDGGAMAGFYPGSATAYACIRVIDYENNRDNNASS